MSIDSNGKRFNKQKDDHISAKYILRDEFCAIINKLKYNNGLDGLLIADCIIHLPFGNVDLYKLYKLVKIDNGGYDEVSRNARWSYIVESLFNEDKLLIEIKKIDGIDNYIKYIYKKYLICVENYVIDLCSNTETANCMRANDCLISNNNKSMLSLDFNNILNKGDDISIQKYNKELLEALDAIMLPLQSNNLKIVLHGIDQIVHLSNFIAFSQLFEKYPTIINEMLSPLGIFKNFRRERYHYWNRFIRAIPYSWNVDEKLFKCIFNDDFDAYIGCDSYYDMYANKKCIDQISCARYSCYYTCTFLTRKTKFYFEYAYMAKLGKILDRVLTLLEPNFLHMDQPIKCHVNTFKFALLCIYTHPLTQDECYCSHSKNTTYYREKQLCSIINYYGWSIISRLSLIWKKICISDQLYALLMDTIHRYFQIDPTKLTAFQKHIFFNIFVIVENVCCSLQIKYSGYPSFKCPLDKLYFVSNMIEFLFKLTQIISKNNSTNIQIFLSCFYTIYKISYILPSICHMYAHFEDFICLLGVFLGNVEDNYYTYHENPSFSQIYQQLQPTVSLISLYGEVIKHLNASLHNMNQHKNNSIPSSSVDNHSNLFNCEQSSNGFSNHTKYASVPFSITFRQLLLQMFDVTSHEQVLNDLILRIKIKLLLNIVLYSQPNSSYTSNDIDELLKRLVPLLDNDFEKFLEISHYMNLSYTINPTDSTPLFTLNESTVKLDYAIHISFSLPSVQDKHLYTSDSGNGSFQNKPTYSSNKLSYQKYFTNCQPVNSSIIECALRILRNICQHSNYGKMLIQIKLWTKITYYAFSSANSIALNILDLFIQETIDKNESSI